jgi:hypothetical protein
MRKGVRNPLLKKWSKIAFRKPPLEKHSVKQRAKIAFIREVSVIPSGWKKRAKKYKRGLTGVYPRFSKRDFLKVKS